MWRCSLSLLSRESFGGGGTDWRIAAASALAVALEAHSANQNAWVAFATLLLSTFATPAALDAAQVVVIKALIRSCSFAAARWHRPRQAGELSMQQSRRWRLSWLRSRLRCMRQQRRSAG